MNNQPQNTSTCAKGAAGVQDGRQSGSVLILVVFTLIVILIIGIAFVGSATQDRISSTAAAERVHSDTTVRSTVDMIGRAIAEDWLAFIRMLETNPLSPELNDLFVTYPNERRPWLASFDGILDATVGFPSDATAVSWQRWPQISKFGPFISLRTPLVDLPEAQQQNSNVVPGLGLGIAEVDDLWTNVSDGHAGFYRWGTASPDLGIQDARWSRLPIQGNDGIVWVAAIRVVDTGGMVNLNTAAQAIGQDDSVEEIVGGLSPADIDVVGLISRSAVMDADVNEDAVRAELLSRWQAGGAMLSIRGYGTGANSVAGRKTFWNNYGARLWQLWGAGDPGFWDSNFSNRFGVFGPSDEAWLRGTRSVQTTDTTSIAQAIDRQPIPSGVLNSGTIARNNFRVTRVLTTYNASRLTQVGGRSVSLMLPWLDQLDGRVGPAAGVRSETNPIPYYRLDPNALSARQLFDAFSLVLRSSATPYEGSDARANLAAAFLAVNLVAYRSPEPTEISGFSLQPPGSPFVFHPVQEQPFFAEVVTIAYRQDRPFADDDNYVLDTEALEPTNRRLIVELRNPFQDRPVNLNRFRLRVDGTDSEPLVGTIPPGAFFLVYSDDPMIRRYVQARLELLGRPLNQFSAAMALPDYGAGNIELVTAAGRVRVDRIRPPDGTAPEQWPAPRPADGFDFTRGDDDATPDQFIAMTVRSLQRDARPNAFWPITPAGAIGNPNRGGGAGNFIYEWRSSNVVIHEEGGLGPNPLVVEPGWADGLLPNLAGLADDAFSQAGEDEKQARLDGDNFPAPQQIITKHAPIETPGEIGYLFTVGHRVHTSNPNLSQVFSEMMAERYFEMAGLAGPRPGGSFPATATRNVFQNSGFDPNAQVHFEWARYGSRMARAGRLRFTEFVRNQPPQIPVAMGLFDLFDPLMYRADAQQAPVISGRININTAATKTMEALPFLGDNIHQFVGQTPAWGISSYRDRYAAENTFDFRNRDVSGIAGIRSERGFSGVGELLAVRKADAPMQVRWRVGLDYPAADFYDTRWLRYLGPAGAENQPRGFYGWQDVAPPHNGEIREINSTGAFLDRSPNDLTVSDFEEQLLLFDKISGLVDVRSDTFVAWVRLVGLRYDRVEDRWRDVAERSFVVLFDRSNVQNAGDMPRVLMFRETQ